MNGMMLNGRSPVALLLTLLSIGLLVYACTSDAPSSRAPKGAAKGLVAAADGLPSGELWRQDFTFADMDGDGEIDLITAPPRKSKEPWPHIFLHRQNHWEPVVCQGVGNNGFPQQTYVYGGVAVADFTGDGTMEIAIAMHEAGIRIFSNTGTGPCGPWEEQSNVSEKIRTLRSRSIVTADMNKDGRVDIVALSEAPSMESNAEAQGLAILWNEASGWRFEGIEGSAGLFGDHVAIGEVNGDGIPDIAAGSLNDMRPQFLWLSDGNGKWQAVSAEGLPNNIIAWSVQLVDFDGDGKDELLLGVGGAPVHQNGGPRVYRWDGVRWNNLSQGLPQVFWVCGVTATDIDGDGRKEIVAAGMYTGTVKVYSQQPDGNWIERQELQVAKESEKLRNYKVRAFSTEKSAQNVIVANYAAEGDGKLTAWVGR